MLFGPTPLRHVLPYCTDINYSPSTVLLALAPQFLSIWRNQPGVVTLSRYLESKLPACSQCSPTANAHQQKFVKVTG